MVVDHTHLQRLFAECADGKTLSRENFGKVLVNEVIDQVLKQAHDVTHERWNDLVELGVLDEVWEACFGAEKTSIGYKEYVSVFESDDREKSEVEKLVDLCSEDEALQHQVFDLEQCLQAEKDKRAAADFLNEESAERMRELEEQVESSQVEIERLHAQLKEVENLRAKLKNVDSEHRLLKRDFDLVFATNKKVQKKMEQAELENRSLRKTIVHMANQLQENERQVKEQAESIQSSPTSASSSDGQNSWSNANQQSPEQPPKSPAHMVWDPAVRALVPITGENLRNKNYRNRKSNRNHNRSSNKRRNNNTGNGRLISPFPRRYTSSHIPRYRRKYEMNELSRIQSSV